MGALNELQLGRDVGIAGDTGDGIKRRTVARFWICKSLHAGSLRTAGNKRGGASGFEELLGRKVVGIGKTCALAGENTDAAADADALRGGLDDAFVHTERGGGDCLEVEIGEVATG